MYIHVKVKAGMKKEEVRETKKDHFEISVKEKAERNMANARVIELLAIFYSIPASNIRLINGHHSPSKLFSIGSRHGD